MIAQIIKKEFLLNIMTFKFAVGTTVSVLLLAAFMLVLVNDYQQQLKDYNENVAAQEAELRKVKVYKNITPTVYRPPNILSVFSKGIEDHLGNSEKISMDQVPEIGTTINKTNTLLSVFPTLDVTLIFKLVVSVLAFLMAYDVISGEREQGTLKLMLSTIPSRHHVLLGKLMAGLLTLLVSVTAAFFIGLLVLLSSRMVSLNGAMWCSIILMYLASLVFVAVMFNFGLLLSCVSKSSATSLVFGLFLWLFLVAILPNSSVYVASQLGTVNSPDELSGKLKAVVDARRNEIHELTQDIKVEGNESETDSIGAFGQYYAILCNKGKMDYRRKVYPVTEPIKIKYMDKLLGIKEAYMNGLIKQKRLAETIAVLSPIVLYENVMSILAGTDSGGSKHFRKSLRGYKNEVVDYIRSETENFTSSLYFTPSKEGEYERLIETYYKPFIEAKDKQKKAQLYQVAKAQYDRIVKDTPCLDLQDFPEFTYRPRTIAEILQEAVPKLGLLMITGTLLFFLSFVAFLRYDIR